MPGNGEQVMAKKAIAVYLKQAISSGFSFIKRKFKSLKELNSNFQAQRTWIFETVEKKADYKRRLVKVLEVLKMHSCKHIGISYLTENHLCEAYEKQFGESISKRTISTYIKDLVKLGLIQTIATKREDGKQSANIIVMQKLKVKKGTGKSRLKNGIKKAVIAVQGVATTAFSGGEAPGKVAYKDEKNLRTKKTKSLLNTPHKEYKERHTRARRLLNFVPKWFKEKIACCATEPKAVYEYWKVAKHLLRRRYSDRIAREEMPDVVTLAIVEFYQAAKAASQGKFPMENPFGFFHTVLETEIGGYIRRNAQAIYPTLRSYYEA